MKTARPYTNRLANGTMLAGFSLLMTSCAFPLRTSTTIDPRDVAAGNYAISAPGAYRLGGDVIASRLADGAPLIRITASDVTLDLGGHAISMPASAASSGNTGIRIDGVSNVEVSNGAFKELSGAAVHLTCDVDPAARRCTNFTFSRLEISNVGKRGEYADLGNVFVRPFAGGIVVFGRSSAVPAIGGAWENSITGVAVSRVSVRNDAGIKHLFTGSPPAGGQNGLTFASVTGLKVEDSAVSGMRSNDAAACIFFGRTKTVEVRRFDCNGATGDRNANGLDSMGNTTSPPAVKKNYDVLLEDSSFSNMLATGPRANESLGVELNGEKFTFRNVSVSDVKNDNPTADGIRATGFQIVNNPGEEISRVTGCTVRNVTHYGTGRDSRVGGVSIEGTPPVVVSRCTVQNIAYLGTNPTSVKVFGFRVEPSARRIVFEDNTVDGVTAPAVANAKAPIPGYVAGFALVDARADMMRNNITRAHVGVFARNLAKEAVLTGNVVQCTGSGTASVPAGLLDGGGNVVSQVRCPIP